MNYLKNGGKEEMMVDAKCESCRYSHTYRVGTLSHDKQECRRYPPTAIPASAHETGMVYEFPDVFKGYWCGEFEKAAVKENYSVEWSTTGKMGGGGEAPNFTKTILNKAFESFLEEEIKQGRVIDPRIRSEQKVKGTLEFRVEDIARIFGVPPHLITNDKASKECIGTEDYFRIFRNAVNDAVEIMTQRIIKNIKES